MDASHYLEAVAVPPTAQNLEVPAGPPTAQRNREALTSPPTAQNMEAPPGLPAAQIEHMNQVITFERLVYFGYIFEKTGMLA